jgi:hypothetical protein
MLTMNAHRIVIVFLALIAGGKDDGSGAGAGQEAQHPCHHGKRRRLGNCRRCMSSEPSRYYWLLLVESHLTRRLFAGIFAKVAMLPSPAARKTQIRPPPAPPGTLRDKIG